MRADGRRDERVKELKGLKGRKLERRKHYGDCGIGEKGEEKDVWRRWNRMRSTSKD